MPILALDKNGNIYQTSSDRADGLGFGCSPECVDEGDVTLGAVYLTAQERRRDELLHEARLREAEARHDAHIAHQNKIKKRQAMRGIKAEEKLLENPIIQQNLLRSAVMQGCECQNRTEVSGNGFTANGQVGQMGRIRDEQAIIHAATGRGHNTAHAVDPVEAEQYRMRRQAAAILSGRGR